MPLDPDTLVDRIYEASLVPELWRAAIDAVCAVSASVSGSILCLSERDQTARGIASASTEETFQQLLSNPGSWDSVRLRRGLARAWSLLERTGAADETARACRAFAGRGVTR